MAGNAAIISTRNIIGSFWLRVEETEEASWVGQVANRFDSDQASEDYPWLGHAPVMREWIGERKRRELRGFKVTVRNKKWEGTLEVDQDDIDRAKSEVLNVRIDELAERAAILPQKVISQLITDNGNAYDGVAFFASTHQIGDSGTIDNDITVTGITAPTDPTPDEIRGAILTGVNQFYEFDDDTGEPMNDAARTFQVMVPHNMWEAANSALLMDLVSDGTNVISNAMRAMIQAGRLSIVPVVNGRLKRLDATNGPKRLYIFRMDATLKPFIWQEENRSVATLGPGSDFHFMYDKQLFGVKRKANGGYGRFEFAVRVTLAT